MKTNFVARVLIGFGLGLSFTATSSRALALFERGAESYKILDQKGQTPTFRVLSDTATKQALAIAAVGLLNAQKEVEPKLPMTNYIDLKFQTLTLTPSGKNLKLKLKLSGYPVDLEQTIDKQAFLKGEPIAVNYPKSTKDVAMYEVTSTGSLRLHLVKEKIIFDNVEAHLTLQAPIGDAETETVRFTGTGQHLTTKD